MIPSKIASVTSLMEDDNHRPQGKHQVTTALKRAALALLAERGVAFSVREVAERANVNHGLVHRHFGSKRGLITAAVDDRNAAVRSQIDDARSPLELINPGEPSTAVLLARLILDDATELISGPVATRALVTRIEADLKESQLPSAEERAALATAIALGWAVFGTYTLAAAGADPNNGAAEHLRKIVQDLIEPNGEPQR